MKNTIPTEDWPTTATLPRKFISDVAMFKMGKGRDIQSAEIDYILAALKDKIMARIKRLEDDNERWEMRSQSEDDEQS